MATRLGDAVLYMSADDTKLKRGMRQAEKDVGGWGSTLQGVLQGAGQGVFNMVAGAVGNIGATVGDVFLQAIEAGSNLEETTNKVNTLFGDQGAAITTWASGAVEAFGQSRQAAMDAAAEFGIFGQAAGLTGEDLTGFSKELTELASDLASFYNTDADQAVSALGAALRGEYEPMRKFGVLLDESTLKAKALERGIWDGEGALTAQQKVLASYAVIMDQTQIAQGDFARTSDSVANQQKILRERLDDTVTAIGEKLQPLIQPLITKFNEIAETVLPGVVTGVGAVVDRLVVMGQAFQLWYATYGAEWERDMVSMWDRLEIGQRVNRILEALDRLAAWFGGGKSEEPFSWINKFSALMTAFVDASLAQIEALVSYMDIAARQWSALLSGNWSEFFRLNGQGAGMGLNIGGSAWIARFLATYEDARNQFSQTTPASPTPVNGPRSARTPIQIGITVNTQGNGLAVAGAARDGLLSALQAAGL